ncbi:unnamed protein product [Nesidiocoris tenuis]|uniref:Uncharacterized protein n=1 Tax=Nesidiocoris tenuis TaxID=355587 RepID=A0A6H5FV44_9HEMI|nr:unnamed protein product [Nesidiocoris tenuis]CAA9993993.1 unnamed protein product [Nesidiocoris tenuis]
MKTTAAIYGLPSEQLPEIDDLKADIKRILPFRLVTTFFFRPLFVSRFPFDMEAIVTNVEMVESIGQDINMLSDPNFKEKSEDDLKEIGADRLGEKVEDGGGVRWTPSGGRRTMDAGRRTAYDGRRAADGVRWTPGGGQGTTDGGRRTGDGGRRIFFIANSDFTPFET